MTDSALVIADDEEAIRFALSREARRHGPTPLVAADGSRAIAASEFEEHQLPPTIRPPAFRLFRKPFDLRAFSPWLMGMATRDPLAVSLALDAVSGPTGAV